MRSLIQQSRLVCLARYYILRATLVSFRRVCFYGSSYTRLLSLECLARLARFRFSRRSV